MDTNGVVERPWMCDSTVLGVGLVLADERNDYEKGIGETCNGTIRKSGVSGSQARSSMQASAKGSVPCAISWIGVE